MKILARDYGKAVGEPFRVEDYRGKKLEMYYLDDRSDYGKFASRGRFSVWTSNGEDFRLFVEKGYYNAVPELYANEINDVWLDFTLNIYGKQKEMSKKYMFISFAALIAVVLIGFGLSALYPELSSNFTLTSMILLFFGLFYSSSRQQKALKKLVGEENQRASKAIRTFLGDEKFEEVVKKQEAYYQDYFKVDVDSEVVDEPLELEENEETNEEGSEDKDE